MPSIQQLRELIPGAILQQHCKTLDLEIQHVWNFRKPRINVLYFVSRYLVFFDVPLAIFYNEAYGLSGPSCHTILIIKTAAFLIGILAAEAILFLRVASIAGWTRPMNIYLSLHYIVTHVVIVFAHILFLISLKYKESPLPGILNCVVLDGRFSSLLLSFGVVLLNQTVILGISLWVGFTKYRHTKTNGHLIMVVFRDGVGYFLFLSALAAANMIVLLTGPPEYRHLFTVPQRVLHSCISTRMILHLRETSGNPWELPSMESANVLEFKNAVASTDTESYIIDDDRSSTSCSKSVGWTISTV
ncbi:hypothetical protein FA15DRAFT_463857 [Coprinopsis marcescibilis]|uniref:DUF6533 domain-containing protein n=1 Tax=Coprinopsis marcescibilis TaxID=230819 RepID=A0A5C3KSF7_COPMA|nr:hypothetical protein FA15DRAFT_463857 [Coprinopsis marcescibilis]